MRLPDQNVLSLSQRVKRSSVYSIQMVFTGGFVPMHPAVGLQLQ